MTDAFDWPDVEGALLDLLAQFGMTDTEAPLSLQSSLPFIRVNRTGGGDDRITDTATVSVDVFDANASGATAVAKSIRHLLLFGLPAATAHGVIDWAVTDVAPIQTPPTDSDNLRLAVASYRISMRREAS